MVRLVLAAVATLGVFAQTSSFVIGSRTYVATCYAPRNGADTLRVVEVSMTSPQMTREFEVWVVRPKGWYMVAIDAGSEEVARALVVAFHQSEEAGRVLGKLVASELGIAPREISVANVGASAIVYLQSAPASRVDEINRYAVFLVHLHLPLLLAVEKYQRERGE